MSLTKSDISSGDTRQEHEKKHKTECPVCLKNFSHQQIESHVNTCLFLKSENKNDSSVSKIQDRSKRLSKDTNISTNNFKKIKGNGPGSSETSETFMCTLSPYDTKIVDTLTRTSSVGSNIPLAEEMRPTSLQEYIGQCHILGPNAVLHTLLSLNEIPSMILWGPPGCGKTSLAHIISKLCKSRSLFRFVKLSATTSGVNDVKEAVKIARNELQSFKRRTILFMDEIHRFNKLQQDIFLPHVEAGTIVLIGATTENPSFSLNSALLSRCRVFVLEKLKTEDVLTILTSAAHRIGLNVTSKGSTSTTGQISIDKDSLDWLAGMSDGDARIAINSLQMAVQSCPLASRINLDDIREGIKRSHLLYDRKGDEHYNIISAMHKSIRASDDNAALYWLARMLEGGEDPMYIARRLVVCASEDIGIEDPQALTMAMSAMQACQLIGMPECGLFLAHVATHLSRAPKSREVYNALNKAKQCVREHNGALPSVPLHLRNAPTTLMRDLGYGAGYNMKEKTVSNLTYMPEGMEDIDFFKKSS